MSSHSSRVKFSDVSHLWKMPAFATITSSEPKGGDGLGHEAVDGGRVLDVTLHGERLGPPRLDLCLHRVEVRSSASTDDDIGSRLTEAIAAPRPILRLPPVTTAVIPSRLNSGMLSFMRSPLSV